MMFDNIRVLHGRTEYDVNTGFRHLQGCYIDHDSTEGKLRRLKSNFVKRFIIYFITGISLAALLVINSAPSL